MKVKQRWLYIFYLHAWQFISFIFINTIDTIAFLGLTGKSLSAVKLGLMKPTRKPSVSSVIETGMFL